MARRSTSRKYDTKIIIPEDEVKAKKAVSDTVFLMIQLETTYKVKGKITGDEYVWRGAGNIQPVNRLDAVDLLTKSIRRGCCGSGTINKPVFVEV